MYCAVYLSLRKSLPRKIRVKLLKVLNQNWTMQLLCSFAIRFPLELPFKGRKFNTFSKYENKKIHFDIDFPFALLLSSLLLFEGIFARYLHISFCYVAACGSCNMYIIKSLKSFLLQIPKNLLIYELSTGLKV